MTDDYNEQLGIKSIATSNKEQLGVKAKNIITQIVKWDWIFSAWYEKIIVMASLLWSGYSVITFFTGVFN